MNYVNFVDHTSQGAHSATFSTFIKLPFVSKIFVLHILSDRLLCLSLLVNMVNLIRKSLAFRFGR